MSPFSPSSRLCRLETRALHDAHHLRIERIENSARPLQCDVEILVALITRHLRLVDAEPFGKLTLTETVGNAKSNRRARTPTLLPRLHPSAVSSIEPSSEVSVRACPLRGMTDPAAVRIKTSPSHVRKWMSKLIPCKEVDVQAHPASKLITGPFGFRCPTCDRPTSNILAGRELESADVRSSRDQDVRTGDGPKAVCHHSTSL